MAKAWFLHKGAMDRDADILLMEHGWDRIASPDEFSMWRKQGDTGKMFVYPDGSWQFLSNLRRILAEGSDSESLKIYVSGQAKPIEHMGNSRLASNPVEYIRRKRAMPNIQTLEQKRRYDLGMQLTQLGKEVLQLNRVKDKNSISNKLNMIGGSFANGYANFSDTYPGVKTLPWELPPADHAQFVADNGIKRFT